MSTPPLERPLERGDLLGMLDRGIDFLVAGCPL
jgi:hypothetical protein